MNDVPIGLQPLVQASEPNPLYQAIMSYLQSRGAVPKMRLTYGEGSEFSYNTPFGDELPKEGVLSMSAGAAARPEVPESRATLVHELAHAADRQMANQFFEVPPTERKDQFRQAYQKLRIDGAKDGRSPLNQYAGRLGGDDWAKKNIDYRSSSNELTGFGAGNASTGGNFRAGPPHVDTTMATELAILLELASRKQPPK